MTPSQKTEALVLATALLTLAFAMAVAAWFCKVTP